MSHPARGAWIETVNVETANTPRLSHPARGAWIETTEVQRQMAKLTGRTPPGVRGLKQPY